jgi:hypothetical protein
LKAFLSSKECIQIVEYSYEAEDSLQEAQKQILKANKKKR